MSKARVDAGALAAPTGAPKPKRRLASWTPQIAPSNRRVRYWIVLTLSLLVILSLDLGLDVGYVASALYVLPVFFTVLSGRLSWVVNTTIAGIVATLIGITREEVADPITSAHSHVFTRITIIFMIAAAGAIGALLIVRSNRLLDVSGELSAMSEELGRQTQLLRAASQIGKVAGWSLDREPGSSFVWSDEVERISGLPPGQRTRPEELLGFIDDAQDRDRLWEASLDCLRDGTPFLETVRATSGDGRHLWVTTMGEAARNDAGLIVGLKGALQDVTRWKEAEATASAQQHRFALFANSVPSIIWTAEPNGEIDYFNNALIDYTGRPAEELLRDQWASALHPADVENTLGEWRNSLSTGEPYATAFRLQRADGEYRWFRVSAQPEFGADGEVAKWWGSAVDVHATRLLEEEASKLAQERHDILESIGDGVITVDHEFRFTFANSEAEALLRRPAPELLGQIAWDVFPQGQGDEVKDAFAAARDSAESQRITTYYPPLESWFDINATPTPQGLTVYFRDVTELKSVSEQLAQAQRMESVGRLTGGIAHDFNNLLTVVVGGTEALDEEPSLTEEGREMLELVVSAAGRGAELTHQLLAFARQQPLAPRAVDVADRIQQMTPILSRAIGPGIREVTRLDDDLPEALVDPGQLENALLNLAINAGDAMPDGGTLTIGAELVQLDEGYSTIHDEVRPGSYVLISVGDSGTGISSELLPHIFEPFFTTKSTGEGSGLGLAMVWGFAKQTGGHVTVYSEEGIGSTFRLYLPVAPSNTLANAPLHSGASTPSRGAGHILLAEDDPLVQQFAAERLRDHGYTVTVANTGVEALELLDGIEDLALLFTDVIMKGGMSGRGLAEAVVSRQPGTPVLYTSGYTEDVIVHQGQLDSDVTLLAKPYTGRQLIERVHSVIGDIGKGDTA